MMQYLAEDDHPGDWTMPEGLYRSGDYIFKMEHVATGFHSQLKQVRQ